MKKYIFKIKGAIALQLLFSFIYSFINGITPSLSKMLFDQGLKRGLSFILMLCGAYLGLTCLTSLFVYISQYYQWKVGYLFQAQLKGALFRRFVSLTDFTFKEKKSSEYISIINNDANALEDEYLEPSLDIIKSAVSLLVFTISMVIVVDYRITLITLLASFLSVMVPKLVSEKLGRTKKEQFSQLEKYFASLDDLFSGKHLITKKSYQKISVVHENSLFHYLKKRLLYGKWRTLANTLTGFAMMFVQFCAFSGVAFLLYRGEITLGAAAATFAYVEQFVFPMSYIMNDVNLLQGSKKIKEEIETYLALPVIESSDKKDSKESFSSIEVQHLSYKNEAIVIKNFNFSAKKGDLIGLVGGNGSGKTTLLSLLSGKIPALTGNYYFNQQKVTPAVFQENVYNQKQQDHIFNADFLANVTLFGTFEFTRKAEKILKSLPTSMQRRLLEMEKANDLSGGEGQIISLLRAISSGCEILLLDEPLSAVDKNLSTLLMQALSEMQEMIILMITHDQSQENLNLFTQVIYSESYSANTIQS